MSTTKSVVFNLIILDESGSMECVRQKTINGCNETINTIKAADLKHRDTIRSLVSVYAFQSNDQNPSHYIIKNADPQSVAHITPGQYRPWGATPLYDAVGETLSELKAVAETHEDASAIVTIITDGEENSSERWSGKQVASLIEHLKEKGWTINLVGANIDVKQMARTMHIDEDNSVAFEQTDEGTAQMFSNLGACACDAYECRADEASIEDEQERLYRRRRNASRFWRK